MHHGKKQGSPVQFRNRYVEVDLRRRATPDRGVSKIASEYLEQYFWLLKRLKQDLRNDFSRTDIEFFILNVGDEVLTDFVPEDLREVFIDWALPAALAEKVNCLDDAHLLALMDLIRQTYLKRVDKE